jgi:hypothetical protein
MTIVLDFDGTCVSHEYPKVGYDIGAVPVLKELISNGHKLILFTMRSDIENTKIDNKSIISKGGNYLTDAVNWFKDNDIELYGIQYNPTQLSWTISNKCFGHLYIDDAALGCPLIYKEGERPFVDWVIIRKLLIVQGFIKNN